MKNPLNYQTTEYDCGPVSLINGIRYLFDREEIYPDIIKNIMCCCLDTYGENGEIGKQGTSATAMLFMANWLNHFGQMKNFPVHCEFLSGAQVIISKESKLCKALEMGAAIVVRLYSEVSHYVLLTGIDDTGVLLFDPYYEELDDPNLSVEYREEGITFIEDQPKRANRHVTFEKMNRVETSFYELGKYEGREALIIYPN
ncbi:MAG: peptidase C39 [Lachnospiraceae bacterium]